MDAFFFGELNSADLIYLGVTTTGSGRRRRRRDDRLVGVPEACHYGQRQTASPFQNEEESRHKEVRDKYI